ncbi:microtubule organization protein AKNA-like isoform X2 [Sphaeramia orbicularis]|uniref:microtubule organization protein AKNA-like isoform X2 n=1 Tax=Sphaeramia orbicularis TaxID=375764 RepID=UPI00117F0509|nr:microtubule organization protein AKNA-like isoform X2 [Sphaeramia orbicularis]
MESVKKTTAGVVFWTPAPTCASPASSVESEGLWDDDEEEQAETDDDFSQQVDDSGIIGLEEALGRVGLEGAYGPLTPRGAEPKRWEREPEPESPGEDEHNTSNLEEINSGFRVVSQREEYLDVREQEEDEDEEQKTERNGMKNESCSDFRTTYTPESFITRGAISESIRRPSLVQTPLGRHRPESPPAPPTRAPLTPHLLHFTTKELAAAPGIEAETLPDVSLGESLLESPSVSTSLKSSPRCPRGPESRTSARTAANHPGAKSKIPTKVSAKSDPSPSRKRQLFPSDTHLKSPGGTKTGTGSVKTSGQNQIPQQEQRTTRAKTKAVKVAQTREGPLSFHTPDFSKVEPRVRFPKAGYKPPKSQRPVKRKSLSPEPPFMFKSPADIVKEVLLSPSDGPPDPPDSKGPPIACEPTSVVPQEFRCKEHAMTLLDELQEDNYRLKIKCAEAANTIDQLRLEAKVNLYSDPPRPGPSVRSGLNPQPLKLMTLEFPQAQRSDVTSASAPSDTHRSPAARGSPAASVSSTTGLNPSTGRRITELLSRQSDGFLQQLQGFDELRKSGKLQPQEQMKGLSQLLQVLDSLERSYLLAKDEHKVLQQHGAESSRFDPERDLEALIFQFGLQMDELKEQVEQSQPTQEAPPTPPPQPTPSPAVSEGEELQSPPLLFTAGPGSGAEVEDSTSAGDEDGEETLKSVFFEPLNKPRRVEPGFTALLNRRQSFEELPRRSNIFLLEAAPASTGSRARIQTRNEDNAGLRRTTGNAEPQRGTPNSKSDPSPVRGSRSSPPPPGPSRHPSSLPSVPVGVGRSHSSSMSSLGEITASERRRRDNKSKTTSVRRTVMCQDGVISPETDSGFIGSESSRLTPAAASPLHQRAPHSVSVKPQTVTDSALRPAPSPPIRRKGGDAPVRPQPARTDRAERRRISSSSSSCCSSTQHPPRTHSESSESGLDSDPPPSVSENDSDHFADSTGSAHSSHLSPSAAAPRHHGDRLRAVSSSQTAKHSEAQRLQAEVNRLKEWFEGYMKNTVGGSASAEHNAPQNTPAPHTRSEKQRSEIRKGSTERRTDDVDNSALRRTIQPRSRSAHRPPTNISEPQTSTHRVSRSTQTPSQRPPQTADEPDGRPSTAPVCPQCLTGPGQTKQSVGAAVLNHSPHHCLICGRPEPFTSPGPDYRRNSNSRPDANTHWTQHNTPVYPPLLLYYPPPLFVSPSKSMSAPSEVRGHGEGRWRRSSSSERRDSVDRSLDRAIRAAQTMKHTSRHMAWALASGLRYHQGLQQTTWTSRGRSSHTPHSSTY